MFTVGIAPAGGDVIADFPFELAEGGSYAVVATGLLGDDATPFGLAATATTFGASSDDVVGLEVYHGSTDAPAVDIYADDAMLLENFAYGDISGFVEVPAADYTLGVAPAGSDIIAAFAAPLSGLGGGSAVAFASGFLSGADPAFGLFAALADGTVLELPGLAQDCAGIWGGDTVVDCAGECGGMAMEDCAGECGGDAMYDCAGVCDGDAVEDVCGACNGTATDPTECVQEGFMLSFGAVDLENGNLEIPLSLCNDDPISGIQVQFNDIPSWLDVVDIVATPRMDGMEVSWNMQGDGSTVLVGFSLTGAQIQPGDGALAHIQYQSNSIYEAEVVLDIIESILSDASGQQIASDNIDSIMSRTTSAAYILLD
jgi:hypothetical protein